MNQISINIEMFVASEISLIYQNVTRILQLLELSANVVELILFCKANGKISFKISCVCNAICIITEIESADGSHTSFTSKTVIEIRPQLYELFCRQTVDRETK